ncbi:hypothetical protein BGZ63DRAFT_405408 [Mariannaea sp. PMI_226]|nr:hypothetical protein BGZ63DRAFT_405408 [Mariannaea sp. PMI_226]
MQKAPLKALGLGKVSSMSSNVINFNKPCNVCRRRKVRCDKAQPCRNCARHRVSCVYEDAPNDSPVGQQMLQDRLDRLERMLEGLTAYSLSPPISTPGLNYYEMSSPSTNSPLSNLGDYSDATPDAENQAFVYNNSYSKSPDSWINATQPSPREPQVSNVVSQSTPEEIPAQPMAISEAQRHQQQHKRLGRFHLPWLKEDVLMSLFFQHIEPWIGVTHQPFFWQLVGNFRQGTCPVAQEVEALLFSLQYITAALLPAKLLYDKIHIAKSELVDRLQQATELAFDQANVMQSQNALLLNALLYYITCQLHIGNYETVSALLSLASQIAGRMEIHEDPIYYTYPLWYTGMKQRIWDHLAMLDGQFCSINGSKSVLMSGGGAHHLFDLGDNDNELQLSGFHQQPQFKPELQDYNFCDEAFPALIRKELYNTAYVLSEAQRSASSCYDLMVIIEKATNYIQLRVEHHLNGSSPLQNVVTRWYNAMIKSLTVSVLYQHASASTPRLQCHAFGELQEQLYSDCLSCLEEFSQGEMEATSHHWQWAFQWPMPLQVVTIMLTCLANVPDHQDTDRAWEQINIAFQRYSSHGLAMAKMPTWSVIEVLCDQAMALHPNRKHEGCAYTKRMYTSESQQEPQHPHHEQQVAAGNETHSTPDHQNALSLDNSSSISCTRAGEISAFDENLRKQSEVVELAMTEAMNNGFSDNDIDPYLFFTMSPDDALLLSIENDFFSIQV